MAVLVAVEGIDGSGKKTQVARLSARARAAGHKVEAFDFPQYGMNPFGVAVADYLNGKYGAVGEVPAELAALLFAGDRFATRPWLLEALERSDLVICDRYVASNVAHQAAKLPEARRDEFVDWLEQIEYDVYRLPHPDLTIYLEMPVEVAAELVLRKGARSYTEAELDIHESDAAYLAECAAVYKHLADRRGADRWITFSCVDSSATLLPPETIAERIWAEVSPLLSE